MNLYTYVGSDPVNLSDPTGFADCETTNAGYSEYGAQIIEAAMATREWTYSQGPYKHDVPTDVYGEGGTYIGDCTDYVRTAVVYALGGAWWVEHPDSKKANTEKFRENKASGFDEIPASEARAGDIVVEGGHAGIYICTDEDCNVWGLANNGSPTKSRRGYINSDTGLRLFNGGEYGTGGARYHRPVSPLSVGP